MHIQLLSLSDTIEMLDTQGVYMLSLSTNKIYRQAVNCSLFSSLFFLFFRPMEIQVGSYKHHHVTCT